MEVTTSAASDGPEATQQDTEHVEACFEQHVDRPVTQDAVTVEVKVTNITRYSKPAPVVGRPVRSVLSPFSPCHLVP